ncbi:transposase, partial [Streptococcus pyogenes]
KPDYNRNQYGFYTLDYLVPIDHFLRQVDEVIDFNFIYELVEDTYSTDNGRPSLDPVMLVKIPLIQCLYGIRSMRQTIKEIEVNMAYRWFLG